MKALPGSLKRNKPKASAHSFDDPLEMPRKELQEFDGLLEEIKGCAQNIRTQVRLLVDAPMQMLRHLEKFFPEDITGGVTAALLREELTTFSEVSKGRDSAIEGVIDLATDLQERNAKAREALAKVSGSRGEAAHYNSKVEELRDNSRGAKAAEKLRRNEQKKHESEQAFHTSMHDAATVLSQVLSQKWAHTVDLLGELCRFYTSVFNGASQLSQNCTELGQQFQECKNSPALAAHGEEIVSDVWATVQNFLTDGPKKSLHSSGVKKKGGAWGSLEDNGDIDGNNTSRGDAGLFMDSSPENGSASRRFFGRAGFPGIRRSSSLQYESDGDEAPMGHTASAPVGSASGQAKDGGKRLDESILAALRDALPNNKKVKDASDTNNAKAKKGKEPRGGESVPLSGSFGGFGSTDKAAPWPWPPSNVNNAASQDPWAADPWPSTGNASWPLPQTSSNWGSTAGQAPQPGRMGNSGWGQNSAPPTATPGNAWPPEKPFGLMSSNSSSTSSTSSVPSPKHPHRNKPGPPGGGYGPGPPPSQRMPSGQQQGIPGGGGFVTPGPPPSQWMPGGHPPPQPQQQNMAAGGPPPAQRGPSNPPGPPAQGPPPAQWMPSNPPGGGPLQQGPPPMQRLSSPPSAQGGAAPPAVAKLVQALAGGPQSPSGRNSMPAGAASRRPPPAKGGPPPGSAAGFSPWGPAQSPDASRRASSVGGTGPSNQGQPKVGSAVPGTPPGSSVMVRQTPGR